MLSHRLFIVTAFVSYNGTQLLLSKNIIPIYQIGQNQKADLSSVQCFLLLSFQSKEDFIFFNLCLHGKGNWDAVQNTQSSLGLAE